MRRRTAFVLALAVAAATLTTAPAQASAWLPGVRVSEEDPNLLTVEGMRVVVDADGTATAVWHALVETPEFLVSAVEVYTATRVAGAAEFGPVQLLGRGHSPAAVVHPDGAVTVAWTSGTTTLATTRQAGHAAFPPPTGDVASWPGIVRVGSPQLAVDGAGKVSISGWSRPGIIELGQNVTCWSATRAPVSGTWSVPEPVVEAPGVSDCTHEAADDGTVTYAWAATGSVWSRTRSPEGTWADPVLEDGSGGSPDVDVDLTDNAAGATALSWVRSGTPGPDLQVSLRAGTDGEFPGGVGLSGSEPVTGGVALVVDDAGRVSGGWVSADGGVVGMSRDTDGAVTTTRLGVGSKFASWIDAVVDHRGTLTLAWQQAGGSHFVAVSRRPVGGDFETPAALTGVADARADEPALGVAATGDVTVLYAYSADPGRVTPHVRSQVLDVNAPALSAAVPATGSPGAALAMSAGVFDRWGPVSVGWSFGDGASATGTSPSHAYAAAGSYEVRVTATDGSGNVATLTRTVLVSQPAAAPVGDRTPPVLSRVRLAPDRLPTGHGAALKVTSTEAGRLVGVVERRRPNGQWREVGTKRWSLAVGRSSKTFYGQAAQERLTTGKHRVRLVATDAAGNASRPVVLRFRVGPR